MASTPDRTMYANPPTAMDMQVMTSLTLSRRLVTIYRTAFANNIMQCLKVIRLTIHNLTHAETPDMTAEQINKAVAYLNCAAMFANQGNRDIVMTYMVKLYADFDETPPTIYDLPHSVRVSIEGMV